MFRQFVSFLTVFWMKIMYKIMAFRRQDSKRNIPSELFSRYSISHVIGSGSYGIVYHCFDRVKGVDLAVKIIKKSKSRQRMIDNEVAILRDVQHPNIVKLVAEHDTPSKHYLIMELVKGEHMLDAMEKAVKFPERDAQLMMLHLASALSYLHKQSILHRDIKPENLLLEFEGERVSLLKICDFGLAQKIVKPLYDNPCFSVRCGYPTFVAPEVFTQVGYGLKMDVWAEGVILYILLCGFPPFESAINDDRDLFDKMLAGQYTFPSPDWDEISDLARDLISHTLQTDPELRYSAEDVINHPWFKLRLDE